MIHEYTSELLIDHLMDSMSIDLSTGDAKFVKELITGHPPSSYSDRQFLYDIIANQRNSVDVDKIDYLTRDSRSIFTFPLRTDYFKLFQHSRVINSEICFRNSDRTRLLKVYNHPTVQIVEVMTAQAIVMAEPVLQLSTKLFSPELFVNVSDSIIKIIEWDKSEDLAEARRLLERIRHRDLYHLVGEQTVKSKEEFEKLTNGEDMQVTIREILECQTNIGFASILLEKDLICYPFKIDFGMKEDNPLKKVKFFEMNKPTEKIALKSDDYCPILSDGNCGEWTLRVCSDKHTIHIARKAVEEYFSRKQTSQLRQAKKARISL